MIKVDGLHSASGAGLVAFALLASIAALSCSFEPFQAAELRLEVDVPRFSAPTIAPGMGAKAMLPGAKRVSVSLTSATVSYHRGIDLDAGQNLVTLTDVPVGDGLLLTVEVLDAWGNPVFRHESVVDVGTASSSVPVRLSPVAPIETIQVDLEAGVTAGASSSLLKPGEQRVYRLEFIGSASAHDYHIVQTCEDTLAPWTVDLFDASGAPVDATHGRFVVADDGWLVVDGRPGESYTAIVTGNPYYEGGFVRLEARRAYYVRFGASPGAGTRASPFETVANALTAGDRTSIFVSGSNPSSITINEDAYLYGKFDSSFSTRTVTSTITASAYAVAAFDCNPGIGRSVVLDGFTLVAANMVSAEVYGVRAISGGLRLADCIVNGAATGTGNSGAVYASPVDRLTVEGSTIRGASQTGGSSYWLAGVYATASNGIRIIGNAISAGTFNSGSAGGEGAGVMIGNPSLGPATISRNYIVGPVAAGTANKTYSAINAKTGSASTFFITSNVLSGGYAKNANDYQVCVYLSTSVGATIVGNIIDAGSSPDADGTAKASYGISMNSTTNTSVALGNVIFSSITLLGDSPSNKAVYGIYVPDLTAFSRCRYNEFWALDDADLMAATSVYRVDPLGGELDMDAIPVTGSIDYSANRSIDLAGSFPSFVPSYSSIAGISGTMLRPESVALAAISYDMVSTFIPREGTFDITGAARGASWSIGAFQL
jgi:hypothetical protein